RSADLAGRLGRRVPDRRAGAAAARAAAAFRVPQPFREQGPLHCDAVAGAVAGHRPPLSRPARCGRLRTGPGAGSQRSIRMSALSERLALIRHSAEEEWTESVAREMATVLGHEIGQRGRARMLLSGGTTPAPVYEMLAEQPLEWARVEVGLADERWLSPQDRDSNAWLVRHSF